MAKADLTAQRLRELLEYDPETGVFTRGGRNCGWMDGKYRRVSLDCAKYWMHRLAFLYMTGVFPANDVDHIDGDGANNAWSNLRDVPTQLNVQNVKRASKNSRTGVLGIERTRSGTFQARIMVSGVRTSIGTFATKEEAHSAYLTYKRKLHEGCTI